MTREQLLKYIELRNSNKIDTKMQSLLDADEAGFELNELPKPTYVESGSGPIKTPHGDLLGRPGHMTLRAYSPEEEAQMKAGAARVAAGSTDGMTEREREIYFNYMTPQQRSYCLRMLAIGCAANRQKRLARAIPDIDWGQATVYAMRKTTPEERAQDEAWAKVKAKVWPNGEPPSPWDYTGKKLTANED